MNAIEILEAIMRHLDDPTLKVPALTRESPIVALAREAISTLRSDPQPARPRLPVRAGLTDEEKARRRATLGSSEVAAVVGVNPYASIHQVWLSKVHGVDFEGNEATVLGNLLEPSIFAIYSDRYGRTLRKGEYTVGPEPWISATPDAYIDEPTREGLVEAKLVGLRSLWMWGPGNTDEEESDAVPLHYLCQAHWQMHVTREPFVDLSALLGTEFRTYRIRRNEEVEGQLVEKCRDFWFRHVVTKQEPPVDGSEGAREMLKHLYPKDGAEPVEADAQLEELARSLAEARAAFDEAEKKKRLHENEIKAVLKDARGAHGDGWRIRYATTKAGKRPFCFEHEKEEGRSAA